MTEAEHDLRFRIRYAVRVLERQTRFWSRLDAIVRMFSLLSGTAAVAGIVAQSLWLAWLWGGTLALMQAVAYVVRPGDSAATSRAQAALYRRLYARLPRLGTDASAEEFAGIKADDPVVPFESLRVMAYNDVIAEFGSGDAFRRPVPFPGPLVRMLQ